MYGILWTETIKISLYNFRSVVCYLIPDAWAYRAKKKKKKKKEKKKRAGSGLGTVWLTMCVYIIVVCSMWGGSLRHRVVTLIRKF